MKSAYHAGRALAIFTGVAATGGAIYLLLADAIRTGHWTQDHALVPLVVGLTVAASTLASIALKRWKLLSAIGFVIAFFVGTIVTVTNGIGRQSEGAEAKMAEAAQHNKAVADKVTDLTRARLRLEQANQMAEKEMTGAACGVRCNDWKLRAKEVGAHIKGIEAELSQLGAVRPVNAKAEKVSEIATNLGFDGKRASALMMLLDPLLVPFLLEWTAITAFGYGFGHRQAQRQSPPVTTPAQTPDKPRQIPPSTGGGGGKTRTRDEALADLRALLKAGHVPPSQDWLKERWGLQSKGTISKWLAHWEEAGLLPGTRKADGRCKTIVSA